ncbi:SNF2 family N-terminal domain-containing protein [Aspergillus egyptiacus]|nr:SNF2 family N-terminal domain-containing protein [Aspergillus egyptiacus]
MAEVIQPAGQTPDAVLLAAARARRIPDYAKKAICLARTKLQPGNKSSSQTETSCAAPELSDYPIIPAFPPLTDLQGQPLLSDVDMLDAPPDEGISSALAAAQEHDGSDKQDDEEFESVESWFGNILNPTMAEKVRYAAAKRKLEIRKKRSENQRHLEEQDYHNENEEQEPDNDLFVPLDADTGFVAPGKQPTQKCAHSESPALTQAPKKRKQQNRISAAEMRKSIQVGFEPIREKFQKKKKPGESPSMFMDTDIADEATSKQRGRRKKGKYSGPDVLTRLHPNVVQDIHESSELPSLGGFTARDKRTAIEELVASIPSSDQAEIKDEKKLLDQAPRKFNNSVRSDGSGGWKMKGLTTSMYNYQLIGCGWMRDRENSPDEPKGGLLCDMMGFGKTLQAIVNIVDGLPADPNDPIKTTLIVVPSHLVKHWMDQMRIHCDPRYIGEVVRHDAHSKLDTLNVAKSLQNFQVVVTTYEEIRRSYPVFKPPKEQADVDKLFQQWELTFEENLGPLHRIKYHRIVLDEAHMIKNRKSSVSIAVRGLTARYKWALSGTPVQNSNEEFYPLFDFLGVPQIKSYEHFEANYLSDEQGINRLRNLLRTYMMRRTHASRFMSLPIITLPDIIESTINVEFSEAEWVLYEAIEKILFVEINEQAKAPDFKLAQCRSALTMILRLRMFCSHLLTAQHIIKYLTRSKAIMGKLVESTKRGKSESRYQSSQIVQLLRAVTYNYKSLVKQRETENDQTGDNPIFNNDPTLIARYVKFMKQLHDEEHWLERYERGICPRCDEIFDKGVVTSCMHLYCEECFALLLSESESITSQSPASWNSEVASPICLKCTSPIEAATRCSLLEELESEKASQTTPMTQKERKMMMARKKQNGKDGGDDEEQDWIRAVGNKMPSAKLTGIRDRIKEWKSENKGTKVVIFSQFINFIRILGEMCVGEGWKSHCLTGKTRIPLRHKYLEEFRTDPEITILIVSLRTGGTGLDMTIAHKCILVDLWWNEAVQYQAFCRLLRHGQRQNVECVKMVVEGSIDEYMLNLQCGKTENINNSMGDDVLKNRDTIIDLLRMFSNVSQDDAGRLEVKQLSRKERKGRLKAFMPR